MTAKLLHPLAAAFPVLVFRGTTGGIPILIGLYIGHRWGLRKLAAYTVAQATIAVALMVADWGATRALPRNFASMPPEAAVAFLQSANGVRVLLIMLLLVVLGIGVAVGAIAIDVAFFMAILFPLCPLSIATTNAVSERVVVGETSAIGVGVAISSVVFVAASAVVIEAGLGALWFVAAFVLGKSVEAAIIARGRWWVLSLTARNVGSTMAALFPFSAQMILGVVYSRAGVFTVERMLTREDLGVFSVASALQNALLLIPTSLALVSFPDLTRLSAINDQHGLRRAVARYVLLSAGAVGVGIALLALMSAPLRAALQVPRPMYPFVVAYATLAVLSIFSTMAGCLLQARRKERIVARLSVLTVTCALLYQLAALSAFGLWGIVAAVAAAELTTIAAFGYAVARPDRPHENQWR